MTQVREKYNQRYAILLDAMNVGIALEEKLSPAVRNICEKGTFTLSRYFLNSKLTGHVFINLFHEV